LVFVDIEEYHTILANDTASNLTPVGLFLIVLGYKLNIQDGSEMVWINCELLDRCLWILQRDNVQLLTAKAHQVFAVTIELKILCLFESFAIISVAAWAKLQVRLSSCIIHTLMYLLKKAFDILLFNLVDLKLICLSEQQSQVLAVGRELDGDFALLGMLTKGNLFYFLEGLLRLLHELQR